jgi:hypothetical protein
MAASATPRVGPRNPYLADSAYPIAHGRCDQQDNAAVRGPTGPTAVLDEGDITYVWVGPGHFGGLISAPYADGGRVVWSNGRENIVKLDYATLAPLATLPLGGAVTPVDEMQAAVRGLDELDDLGAMLHAGDLARRYLTGLDGVYSLVDRDNTLFVGLKGGAVAFTDADPSDRASAIVEARRWVKPPDITGTFVGMNLTFDGRLVLTTDHGWVVALARDFRTFDALRLPKSEGAAEWCAEQAARFGHAGYGWVRKSCCVDEGNGIYVPSRDHLHKVVWTGRSLSLDGADGAWSAPYSNNGGNGSGTTPSLMGFGDEDRFVVIGDGDRVVNITLMWRDAVPDDWAGLPGAPSRRIAGMGRADMGDGEREDIQTEQSVTVSGFGAMTVNNDPPTAPEGFPYHLRRHLPFFLGNRAAFTPHGLHKYRWDPGARSLVADWVNTDVSSPNSVPFVSQGSDLVYTCGARDGRWTIEAVDWTTGAEAFHYVVGGSQFNTLGAGVTLDEEGRLLYGTIFGKVRIDRPAGAQGTAVAGAASAPVRDA